MAVPFIGAVTPGRRKLIGWALARSLSSTTALVVVYYLLPLDETATVTTLVQLLIGLIVVGAFGVWQVRSIVRASYPGLRAVETLATAVPLYLLLFAAAYYLLAQTEPSSFTQPLTRTDTLYFTVTVFATVGFGDIAPASQVARVVTTFQMVANLVVVGLLLRAVLGAVQAGRSRLDAAGRPPDGGPGPAGGG
ncbi:potassium channel family protein [Pseudonocardia bannensis]|uniref:Two pore domain potassium channel family protein n=1 Tax=Pseudonocardia bannensis TaxID=630973 RepID=A0A848DIF1_9PSEU|nr:potassium channel family protein [Pseudonocardia bannensis]NMH92271.1 two pore domain potassium channel family protein [Pseudonocardia bannensis]